VVFILVFSIVKSIVEHFGENRIKKRQ